MSKSSIKNRSNYLQILNNELKDILILLGGLLVFYQPVNLIIF